MNYLIKELKVLLNNKKIHQMIKFVIVWCIGTWICLWITYILTEYAWSPYIFSAFLWQLIGITNNFFLNKYFTFQSVVWSAKKQYLLSLLIYCVSISISLWITYLLTEYLHIWYIYAVILSIFVTTIINFVWHKLLVFPSKHA